MQVAKSGNSLAVRLPAALVQALGIAEGDDVELRPLPKSSKSSKASGSAQSPAGGVQVRWNTHGIDRAAADDAGVVVFPLG